MAPDRRSAIAGLTDPYKDPVFLQHSFKTAIALSYMTAQDAAPLAVAMLAL